jgi:hypothetical protein
MLLCVEQNPAKPTHQKQLNYATYEVVTQRTANPMYLVELLVGLAAEVLKLMA